MAADGVRDKIEGIRDRYGVAEGLGNGLETLVRWLDCEKGNYLPETAPALPDPNTSIDPTSRRRLGNVLREVLTALQLEPVRAARRVADIGSGAGLPGLVLGIALHDARVTLIEKGRAKCGFLREAIAALGLDNVEVVQGWVQNWSEGRAAYDLVTSRRVARPDAILPTAEPLLVPGGTLVCFGRGRNAEKEELAVATGRAIGLELSDVHPIETEKPRGQLVHVRHLYVYRKLATG